MSSSKEMPKAAKNWREYFAGTRESIEVYRWVWTTLLGPKGHHYIKRMAVFLILNATAAMILPWVVGRLFDALVTHDARIVILGLVGAAGLMIASQIFQHFQFANREIALGENTGSLDRRTNELFFEKSLGQHLREHDTLSAANVEKGRNRVLEISNMLLCEGLEVVFVLVLSYVLLWLISPVAGMIVSAVFVIYLAWSLFLNQKVVEVCGPLDDDFRALNRHRVERWERVERVKTFGKEKEETRHMDGWFNRIIREDRRFWLWYIRHISYRGLMNIAALVGILAYGSWLVWNGSWAIGVLMPLYIWTRMVVDNIWRLGHIEHRLNWNMPAVRSMKRALTTPPDIKDKPDAVGFQRDSAVRVELVGVSHTYPGRPGAKTGLRKPRPVLHDVNFTVEPSEVVALIGRSGAGKTTIMRLLQRGMDPDCGKIRVNGYDLRGLCLGAWLNMMGYVPQQPAVLDGTIRYNLLYGLRPRERERVTDDELWALMRDLQIDFGERLTNGLETRVGRNGVKLSGGEAQRLMVGAAALKHPRFMIIDEATSSLDSTTEKAVQGGLAKVLCGGMSALIIAHRLSTVRDICTKFVVLRRTEDLTNGAPQVEAVADSFEELHAISPTFCQLAHDQGIVIT